MALTVAALLPFQQISQENVERRLNGADPALCLSRFVNYPQGAARDEYALNPRFWLKGIDFSCVSPWNSAGGRVRAGTAISKRHIVFAKHFPLTPGVRIVFVGEDGGVCPCSVAKTKPIDLSDLMIGSLNAELTPNIKPAKLLPDDYGQYIGNARRFPVVTFDQYERAFLSETDEVMTNATIRFALHSRWPAKKKYEPFKANMVVGDSGNPAFMLIGDKPVLLYCLERGGGGQGPALHLYKREIQKAMDELCPGYKLETFDFSVVGR